MKKIFILFLISICFSGLSYGKQIDEHMAKVAGAAFLKSLPNINASQTGISLELVYKATDNHYAAIGQVSCYYVFNVTSGPGFVIVSADDRAIPVLGYSLEKSFNPSAVPPHVQAWLDGYQREIIYALTNDIPAVKEVEDRWNKLVNGSQDPIPLTSIRTVNPLCQTQWDQSPNYNALCPFNNQYNEYTVSGCVATAMAQVMKFWNAPATGSGFHSYNSNQYGTLSADFGSTTYDWNSMPNSLSGANNAVATLMYHCGVSVDMNYGVGQTGGSSAYVVTSQSPVQHCSEYSLKTYFGFKTSLAGQMRDDYSLSTWISKLKADLDASRPVLYAGIGDGGGHCFVCDGYDQSDYFHFNWGWSGQYDGYFQIDALNPTGVGTGGGSGGFNSYQQAVFGIEPEGAGPGPSTSNMQLYADVTASSTSIYYGSALTIHTDIWNNSTSDFHGDYCAAIFDNNSVFVGMVDSITDQTLPANYHYTNGLDFSTDGLFTMLPGTYYIGIYFRPTGDNWYAVADGEYSNGVQITVTNPNAIELYAPMSVTPGTTLIQGQPVGVHLDVVNTGTSSFNGIIDVSLYDLDGYFVFTIGQFTTTEPLPPDYHYTNGLDFNIGSLDADPGTYLLATQHLPSGGDWELTGSTYYQNPVEVTIHGESLSQDPYEPNNEMAQVYDLPVNIPGTQATITTNGSNCHIGSDYDYYRIDLPTGYSYVLYAQIYDANHPGGGPAYSLDAIFAYSVNGTNFSLNYDGAMPGTFTMINGGPVYFKVSPKFTGQTGTYLLSVGITKNPAGIEDPGLADLFRIYPNPAADIVSIDLSSYPGNVESLQIVNTGGVVLKTIVTDKSQSSVNVDLKEFPEGLYFIQLMTGNGLISKKLVVNR